jgi:hypothetical protein
LDFALCRTLASSLSLVSLIPPTAGNDPDDVEPVGAVPLTEIGARAGVKTDARTEGGTYTDGNEKL